MMTVNDAITGRRSIRKYSEKDVPDSLLEKILEAVRWSPSWNNSQCWEIIAVRDAATKQKLAETLSEGNPARRAVTTAPILLAVCGRLGGAGYIKGEIRTKFGDWFLFDLGVATQTLCLSAHSEGLGTVVVGLFDHARAAEILEVKAGVEVVALVPLGYPDHAPKAPKRREVKDFLHVDTYEGRP